MRGAGGAGVRVVVVGGGVIGVGTAWALMQRFPHCKLTLVASRLTPNTTGDGAAGLWGPYIMDGTSEEKIVQWSGATMQLYRRWWEKGLATYTAAQLGVSLVHGHVVTDEEVYPEEAWQTLQPSYRLLTLQESQAFGPKYKSGFRSLTFTAEPSYFLGVLLEEVRRLGGEVRLQEVQSLAQVASHADLVINCSGLGARLLANDPDLYPVRGQVMRVEAPWVGRYLADDSEDTFCYIIPNQTTVVLGGTQQRHDWRLEVDPDDSRTIWDNCTSIMPSLKGAKVVREWVGLRPCRSKGVRLEEDQVTVDSRSVPVIHNYGHGGCGITLFWGCALEVADMADGILHRPHRPASKL